MLKNFLLSKFSVLTFTTVVLNSLVAPVWSMEEGNEEDKENNNIIIKKINELKIQDKDEEVKNTNTGINYFSNSPTPIKTIILALAAFDLGSEDKDFANLASVCKEWRDIGNEESVKNSWHKGRLAYLQGTYNLTDPKDIETLKIFYKGKLIYRANPESDDGRITLSISNLKNPLEGVFDLSKCGDSGKYLSIATGYRKNKQEKNSNKVEIWLSPRFMIEKELQGIASHFAPIMSSWDAKTAPIGLFFTWGTEELEYYDYLTKQDIMEIASISLRDITCRCSRTNRHTPISTSYVVNISTICKKFHVHLVN